MREYSNISKERELAHKFYQLVSSHYHSHAKKWQVPYDDTLNCDLCHYWRAFQLQHGSRDRLNMLEELVKPT